MLCHSLKGHSSHRKPGKGQALSFPPKLENRLHKANGRNDGSLKVNPVSVLQKNLQKSSVNGLERSDLQAERC